MCLAIPGKVIAIDGTSRPTMGTVSFSGIRKDVCLEYVPDVKVGDYIIAHVGFAINRMDEEEANKTLELFNEIGLTED